MTATRGLLSKLVRETRGVLPNTYRHTPLPRPSFSSAKSAPAHPLLLFDLNGTLVNTTDHRQRTGRMRVPPGVVHLKRLLPHFRLGVYSCDTNRKVREAVRLIDAVVEDSLFTTHLDAKACDVFPDRMEKPLRKHFGPGCLSDVLLIDDTPHKSAPGERDNMIVVPTWHDADDDDCVRVLIDTILSNADVGSDVRSWRRSVARSFDVHAR